MSKHTEVSIRRIDRELRHALRPKDEKNRIRSRKAALSELRELDTTNWPFAAYWLRDWFDDCLASGRTIVKSASSYCGAVIKPILSESMGLDFQSMDGDEFAEFYETILNFERIKGRVDWKAGRLDQLHRFGVERFNLQPLPESLTTGNGSSMVDARIVPERLFLACRERVCRDLGQDEEHREALWVYMTMTYRGALRRCELVKLLRQDINYGDTVWLLIRGNRFGTNKSRLFKVPISALLLGSERQRVHGFLSYHRPTKKTARNLVFHESGLFEGVWDANLISRKVSEILEELAPGHGLTLHNFRHTTLSRLSLVIGGTERRIFELTPFDAAHRDELRRVLLKSTPNGKDDYWCLASMPGHGSPAVTFRNYIHTLDIQLHDTLTSISTPWTRNTVRNVAGTTHRVVNRWFETLDDAAGMLPLNELDNCTFASLAPFVSFVDADAVSDGLGDIDAFEELETDRHRYNIDRAFQTLKIVYEEDKDHLQVSADTGIPVNVIGDWLDKVEIISGLTTQRPRKRPGKNVEPIPMYRHISTNRLDSVTPGKLPRRPKFFRDHRDIPKFIAAIEDASRGNRDALKALCRQWLTRMTTSSAYLPIDSPEQLGIFLSVLTPAISHARWRLVIRVPADVDTDACLNKWRIHEKLIVEASSRETRNTRLYPQGKGELYLRSINEEEILKSKNIHNCFNEEQEIRSAGKFSSSLLRFGLFFATVVYFETWEVREMAGLPAVPEEQLLFKV
jgi:integrase